MTTEATVPVVPASVETGSVETTAPKPAEQSSAIAQELKRSGVLEAFGLETLNPAPAVVPPVEDKGTAAGQTKTESEPNPPEKELANLKSVLGRQSNELGELRKKTAEYEQKLAELVTKTPPTPTTPPVVDVDYDAILRASDADIEAAVRRKAQEQNVPLSDAEIALEVKTIRMDARLAKAEKVTKTIEQKNQELQAAHAAEQRDLEFFKTHPELNARADKMAALAKQMFPQAKGLADIAQMGFDPYSIMHTLYELASLVPAMGAQAVAQATATAQSATMASQGGLTTSPPASSTTPLNAFQQEMKRTFPDIYKL